MLHQFYGIGFAAQPRPIEVYWSSHGVYTITDEMIEDPQTETAHLLRMGILSQKPTVFPQKLLLGQKGPVRPQ